MIWSISLITAPVGEVMIPIFWGIIGIGLLREGSKNPSLSSRSFNWRKASWRAPMPFGSISSRISWYSPLFRRDSPSPGRWHEARPLEKTVGSELDSWTRQPGSDWNHLSAWSRYARTEELLNLKSPPQPKCRQIAFPEYLWSPGWVLKQWGYIGMEASCWKGSSWLGIIWCKYNRKREKCKTEGLILSHVEGLTKGYFGYNIHLLVEESILANSLWKSWGEW